MAITKGSIVNRDFMLDVNSHQSGAAQEQWFSVEQVDYQ